jgi:hypothetical protein
VTAAGFSPSAHDPALFVHASPRERTLLLLYVDDMIITGDDSEYIADEVLTRQCPCLGLSIHGAYVGAWRI